VVLVLAMVYFTIRMSLQALRATRPIAAETPYVPRQEGLAGAAA
jgi:hypothetical protein